MVEPTYLLIPEREVCWEEQEWGKSWGVLGHHPVVIKYHISNISSFFLTLDLLSLLLRNL